jgi:hypothetical protein
VFLDAFAEAKAEPPKEIPLGPPFFLFADDEKFVELISSNGLLGSTPILEQSGEQTPQCSFEKIRR